MAWYAAHIVCYVRFCDDVQDAYPIWEKVILIEAEADDVAHVEAQRIGQTY